MNKNYTTPKRILVVLAAFALAIGSASAQSRIKKVADKAAQKVGNVTHKVADKIVDTSQKVADKVVDTSERVADKVVDAKDKVVEGTLEAKDRVVEKTLDVKDKVVEGTLEAKDRVVEKTLDVKDKVVEGTLEAKDKVVEKTLDVKDKVVEGTLEAREKVAEKAADVKEKVVDTTQRVAEKAEEVTLKATEKVVETSQKVAQRVEDKIDDFKARRASGEYPECLASSIKSVDYWAFDVEDSSIPTPEFHNYADALKGWPALPTAAQLQDEAAMRQYFIALKAFDKGLVQMASNRAAAEQPSGDSGVNRADEYSDILAKILPVAEKSNAVDGPASELQKVRKEIVLDWAKSEECAQVKALEEEFANRALEYDKEHPSTDKVEYPFLAEERAKQNKIIDAYNVKVAQRWHAAVQDALAAGEPDFKLVAEQDARLESLGWSSDDEKAQYSSASSLINGAGTTLRVNCFSVPAQLFAVPFVHHTSVETY